MQKVKTDKMLSQLGHLNDEQFKVLFFIYNSINLNSDHTNRVKIYRAVLADLTGKSERTISRITDKLAEQGLIIKDNVSDGSKLYNYYGLPPTKKEEKVGIELQKTEENLVTGGRVKEHERTVKNIKENKIYNISNNMNNILEEKENIINNIKEKELDSTEFKNEVEDNHKIINNISTVEKTVNKNKFQLLEEFVEDCFKNKNTYQESVSQVTPILDWIHERYSDSSNIEQLQKHANELINKKLSVYSSPVNVVTTGTVQVEDDGLPF